MTIPSGPLREPINALKKYQHVFLNGNLENTNSIKQELNKINPKSIFILVNTNQLT